MAGWGEGGGEDSLSLSGVDLGEWCRGALLVPTAEAGETGKCAANQT